MQNDMKRGKTFSIYPAGSNKYTRGKRTNSIRHYIVNSGRARIRGKRNACDIVEMFSFGMPENGRKPMTFHNTCYAIID